MLSGWSGWACERLICPDRNKMQPISTHNIHKLWGVGQLHFEEHHLVMVAANPEPGEIFAVTRAPKQCSTAAKSGSVTSQTGDTSP